MKTLTENKGILGTIAIFIVIMFIYNLFFRPEVVSLSEGLGATSIGNDLVKMHEDLRKVSFDENLFSSSGYLLLTDFSVSIPQQPTGRTNPFNVIGRD